jgi:hypothetical protein
MVLSGDLGTGPLKPMMDTRRGRTSIPEDLSGEDLDELEALIRGVSDEELLARIADVLWTRRRNHAHARIAIDAYLKSARRLEAKPWQCVVRLKRAQAFAFMLNDAERLGLISSYLEEALNDPRPSLVSIHALENLPSVTPDDADRLAARAEELAGAADKNIVLARRIWECAAECHRRAGDADAERRCRIEEAETYVAEAERASDADSALFMKIHFYQQAIEAFRRVGKCRDRVDQLHRIVLSLQERTTAQLRGMPGPQIDIYDVIQAVTSRLDGLTFLDALAYLALAGRPPPYPELRKRAIEGLKNSLASIFSRQTINEKGRVVSRSPSAPFQAEHPDEVVLNEDVYWQLSLHRDFAGQTFIEPARRKIWMDHAVTQRDFLAITAKNPLVPLGRERLFARGLYAGLSGDMVESAHILTPQLENAIRELLNAHGILTSSIDSDGVQEENSLTTLLGKSELVEILGEDTVWDLRGLLAHKGTANLRNRVAHGLLPYEHFFSTDVLYLWWLTLRLCFLPIVRRQAISTVQEDRPTSKSESDPAPE